MTQFLVSRFIRDHENIKDPDVRLGYGLLEAWVSIVLNIVLASLMFLAGSLLNSIALTANSFHTAADVITSVAVLVGFRASRLPADASHPYGHGRAENIATLVIAFLLLGVGYQFLTKSVARFVTPEPVGGSAIVVVGLLVASAVKEWMARFSIGLGKTVDSSALEADAWHHRSDAISMLIVGAGMLSSGAGYARVDAVLGGGVSLLIGYTGYRLMRGAMSKLLGEKPSDEVLQKIDAITRQTDGVLDTHKVLVHEYGGKAIVSLHIQVDPEMPTKESHEIAARVKYRVAEEVGSDVIVHVEPHLMGG